MAGRLGSEAPLEPACWRRVREELEDTEKKFRKMKPSENGGDLFLVLDLTLSKLPEIQREQFKLMAVVAPGVPVATMMMANLWDTVCMRHCAHTTSESLTQIQSICEAKRLS